MPGPGDITARITEPEIQVQTGARDVSLVLVSRAPIEKLAAFKKRMAWFLENRNDLALQPSFVPNFSASVDYWRIDISGAIGTIS